MYQQCGQGAPFSGKEVNQMRKGRFWLISAMGLSFALMGGLQNVALDTKAPRITKEELKSILVVHHRSNAIFQRALG
jgi:hypothetical protein